MAFLSVFRLRITRKKLKKVGRVYYLLGLSSVKKQALNLTSNLT